MSFYTRVGLALLAFEVLGMAWNLAQGNTGWLLFGVALMAATVIHVARTA